MVLVRCLVFLVEALCRLVVAVLERLGASPVVHRLVHIVVQAMAYVLTELLNIESVQQVLAETITAGMNCFLRQPNMEEHLLQLADTMSRTQPELARKQGRDFPVLVGNFLQGMLSRDRENNHTTTATKPARQKQPQQTTPSTTELLKDEQATSSSSRGSSPGVSPLPHTLSIPNLQRSWSHEPEDGAPASKRGFYNNYYDGTGTTQSDRSCGANSESGDAPLVLSPTTMMGDTVEDGSFHYRYGPTGVGSSGVGIFSSFSTVEQKKVR